MSDRSSRLSEEEARHVWERAVELHASAADAQARRPSPRTESASSPGYDLRQVRDAAAEVGIAPEHVALALAERLDSGVRAHTVVDRLAQRLSGAPNSLAVSRRFAAAANTVQEALRSTLSEYRLTVIELEGDSLEGGLQIYARRDRSGGMSSPPASDLMMQSRIEEIRVRLLPIDAGSCIVTLAAPLGAAKRAHFAAGAAFTAGGSLFGGWALGAIGAAVVLPSTLGPAAALAVIGGAMVLGAGAGGSLGAAGSRASYRTGQHRGKDALERLLREVDTRLRDGGAAVVHSVRR